jgi:DNA-directed RNA polymerase subunit RPC12/RpoP
MKECIECKIDFIPDKNHPQQNFCSKKCRELNIKKKYHCIDCGKPITDKNTKRCKSCEMKRRWREKEYRDRNYNGENNPNFKGGKPNCIDCGKGLCFRKSKNYKPKRCNKCHITYLYKINPELNRGKNHPRFGKKYPELSKKIKGKNNPNWIDGRSFEPYTIEFNQDLKNQIKKRDKYECKKCGKKGTHIHHIDYNKQNCEENNLITLCIKCNGQVNANRGYWKRFFTAILINKED